MKNPATAIIIATLVLFSASCEKKAPRLDGVDFSDIRVQGVNAELALHFVVRELSHANARLGIANAPKISVVTYEELVDSEKTVRVTLTAWTSNGLHVTGSATECDGSTMADLVAVAARELVLRLSEKMQELPAPAPAPKERLNQV